MQKGSKSKGMNLADVAKLHGMTAQELMPQLRKGIKHEYEHTSSKQVARRTALDHLVEFPDYYDRLDKIEKMHLGGDMSKHLAPNGKPSNLTHEQWHLVRTPEFKAWFGDWENDPENASKVVDENGEPLLVYHGTPYEFTIFKKEKPTIGAYGQGYYFTNDKSFASNYARSEGSKILTCFLNVKNIFEIDDDELPLGYEKYSDMANNKGLSRDFTTKIKSLFYDGILAKNRYNENEFIVFESNQIKLADGSNTTFDGDNPNIRFDKGGEIENLIDQGEIELKVYPTTPKHANLYGLKSENPLYIQSIFISENQRLKGIGKKVLKYLNDFAIENGHDVMFGHITQKASFSKDDSRQSNLDDVAMIKNWLQSNGYEICEGNNDFYKVVNNPDIRFEKGGLIAPNGKPSNLTQEQWKLVRTPEFKAWFGDWENDPKNASKVVDENGEPLVVYHGTDEKFNSFSYDLINTTSNYYDIIGFYFTSIKPQKRNPYGKYTKSFFLNLRKQILVPNPIIEKNPYWMTKPLKRSDIILLLSSFEPLYKEKTKKELIDILAKSEAINDQLIFIYREFFSKWILKNGIRLFLQNLTEKLGFDGAYMPHSEYLVAFHPNQIKLADGSNTTFDGSNPDIRFKRGGRTIAQTPAPLSEIIYGSKKNVKGSAASKVNRITFTTQLTKSIKNKVDEHNEEYPENKVTLATAKAVVRRGMGAYSKSHRPTISDGMPNSRQAWGLARLNKFLMKKSGKPVKKAYIQDDDLL